MQALAVLLIDPPVAVFENTVGEVFKLLAKALLAVHHLADLIFRMQLGGFEPGGDLTEIGLERGIDIPQAAQLVVQQLTLLTPVGLLRQLLAGGAQLNIQLSPFLDEIGPNLIGARFVASQPTINPAASAITALIIMERSTTPPAIT
ncbi:hypothetical protein KPZU09_49500 [Klebsiella pneumoniae]|uniref:Uncharacterized protein n=1 Tax=Klebsiella pneumoniae TaxID=573 RepID=A0A919LUS1_KLEPN|nr:hypothetical protein KPZU09_49500 [Klebsiella pneumoniae]